MKLDEAAKAMAISSGRGLIAMVSAAAMAVEAGLLTPSERKEILKEAQDGMHELATLVSMVEKGVEG